MMKNTFVGLKCLTETGILILCDHVDHTCFHIVEMGCQMVLEFSYNLSCSFVMKNTFVGLKCLTETEILILCDHVDHTCFHIVEMGCQMVEPLSAYIAGQQCSSI